MMTRKLVLCLLGLLNLHSSVFGQEATEVQLGVLIFCDDPSVEKAVDSAVQKFNEGLVLGNKLALYQILSASKSKNGSDSVYSLQFTTRRSDCPAWSKTRWTECNYLPVDREPTPCNATVYMTENEADTRQVNCQLDDLIFPEKAFCLGCPTEIDPYSDDLKGPLITSILKFNSISDSTHLFNLHNVGRATRQVVAGFRFKLSFDMKKTICAKAEHKDLNELCVPDEENMAFTHCNSTVDVAPWRLEPPQAELECKDGPLPMMFSRRLPPGFSPLRNLLIQRPSIVQPTATQTSVKEESSEEDTIVSSPSASSEPDVPDSPFHCPSKPWKTFNSVKAAAPTQASIDGATSQPSLDLGFSDADLLG